MMNSAKIPPELKEYPNWVCGDANKVPFNPKNHKKSKADVPGTWGTYDEAVRYLQSHNANGIRTIGFEVGESPFVGIDIDHCRNYETGQIEQWAMEIIRELDTYTEISPSGTGIRMFVTGDLPPTNRKNGNVEIANTGKYFSVTGNHLDGTPDWIGNRPEELRKVFNQYFPEKPSESVSNAKTMITLEDSEIIQRAGSAKNGEAFKKLFSGDYSDYPSQSEADLALCCHFAFWCGNNPQQIERLFRQSGLYRDKWNREDYRTLTIQRAIEATTEVYRAPVISSPSDGTETKDAEKSSDILSQLFRWNDIADMDVLTEWLLDGLIPKGAITLVFCPGGGGKTWLLMQIARVVATGIPFGDLQTLQCPVYFVDFENPLSVVKERREKIGPAKEFYYWHLACPTGPRKLDDENWTDYMSLPPGLLIFDTLRASHNGDENSSKDMALVLSRLKELREKGFTIIVLHHTPKGNDGTYKGSTAILDLADHVLSLEKQGKTDDDEFDPDAIYKFGCRIKTRFEPNSIFLSFDPAHGFSFKEDPDVESMTIMRHILEKEGPLKQKDFKKILEEKLEMKQKRIFKLFKKGTGVFWKVERGEKNSLLFSSLSVFPPYIGVENRKTESGGFTEKGKHNQKESVQNVDAQEFASFPEGIRKTGKQDERYAEQDTTNF